MWTMPKNSQPCQKSLILVEYQSYNHFGNVAQSVEQRPFKPFVVGSIPTVPTKRISNSLSDRNSFV